VKVQLSHADEQTDINDEAILRKQLKIGIKGRCALYLAKEDAKYIMISSACRKEFPNKNDKIWKWT
jgi:hypothetical protein